MAYANLGSANRGKKLRRKRLVNRAYYTPLIILLVIILVVIFSCGRKKESSRLVIGLNTQIERLNPITIKNPQTFQVAWQIYEGLLDLDESGQIVPRIAERWETEDNKVWVFHIRKGVTFHRSEIFDTPSKTRNVTSHDVLHSFTSFCSPGAYPSFVLADSIKGCAEYSAGKAKRVKGLRVVDDYTFEIELNKPEPFFLYRITSPWIAIFPKEANIEKYKDRWGLDIAVGTGPYRLLSKTDNQIVLARNEDYWDKSRIPKIEKLVFRVIKNDQMRFSELLKNKIDLMILPNSLFFSVFDTDGNPKQKYKRRFKFKEIKTFNHHFIGVNIKKIRDIHLRRAMFYGTNRKEMVKKVLLGYADILGGAIPPGMNGYIPTFKRIYDPDKAKKELKQSKYDGREIELLVHDLASSEQICQVFQKQMKNIGINIKLTKLDFNSVIGRMVKGDVELFSMFAEIVFSSPEPLLLNLFSTKKIPVPNFWHYSNPNTDKRLEELRNLTDRNASLKACAEIEREIMEYVPAIFLYRQNQVVMFSNAFSNLKINSHNHYMFEKMEKLH